MTIRKFLIAVPVILIVFLLQSHFWVPTYEAQSRGNSERLHEYISASIGDAAVINPILSADSASSQIESLVFEGLIDRDENLHFRGRLAKSWEIHEEAFFYVNDAATVPGIGKLNGAKVVDLIEKARQGRLIVSPNLKNSLANIREIHLLPASESQHTLKEAEGQGDKKVDKDVNVLASAPERVQLMLQVVDQDLFVNLSELLGYNYFAGFDGASFLKVPSNMPQEKARQYAAELMPSIEHNPTILFHLRPGVKFHDGHPLDATDVKFTFEALMEPKNLSPRMSDYEPVKQIEILDPLTLKVIYKRLHSPALSSWEIGILPEHLLNAKALSKEAIGQGKDPVTFSLRDSKLCRQPCGAGPFVFKEWASDQYIKLDRFSDYWEGAPNYKRYTYRIIPDALMQEVEFYAGTIDSYDALPHQVARLSKDARFQNFSGLSFGYTYIGYNMRKKPFDDVRVRKALSMAIDVDQIIKYVLYGQGERITGPFVKQSDYYNTKIAPTPYDPEGALRLLESAGWKKDSEGWLQKNGKRLQFTLIANQGNDLRKAILAIAQNGWRKIGIDVRTDIVEWAVFVKERVNKLDFDALVLGWSMGIEPDLFQVWHSSQTHPEELNFVGFNNKEADDLIVKIRQEYDQQRQIAYCHRLHEIIAQQYPYTFLYVGKWTALLDKRIVIMEPGAQGRPAYKRITPTPTGNFSFYFKKWTKLADVPYFQAEG